MSCNDRTLSLPDRRHDDFLPVGKEAIDGVFQTLGARNFFRAYIVIPAIIAGIPGIVVLERRRTDVVTAPPDEDLFFAVLCRRFGFVQPLQCAVVPLV